MRRAAKVDRNQVGIVEALRASGATVQSLGQVGSGCPDLLVGVRGTNFLLEVKVPGHKPNKAQLLWHSTWRGQFTVVWTIADALAAVGLRVV